MNHLEQTIKELHQNFSGFEVFSNSKPIVRHHILVTNNYLRELENLIIQSYIRFIDSEIERLKGEVIPDEPVIGKRLKDEKQRVYGYNLAIKDQITHLKQDITNAEKLLNK